MRIVAALSIVALVAGTAAGQPGAPPPAPSPYPAPYPQPYPQPAPQPAPTYGVPAPYAYQPQPVALTPEEQEMLMKGEISDGEHLGGGLAALFLGFGIGQGIQGRWSDKGWLFTLGDVASMTMIFYGLTRTVDCADGTDHSGIKCVSDAGTGWMIGGALAFTGLRIWQTIDAFAVPAEYNSQVRRLRMRVGYRPMGMYSLYLSRPTHGDGGVAGLSLRF